MLRSAPSPLVAALALTLAAATSARAQSAAPTPDDSLPVRAGTWALEGGINTNGTTTPTVGVLRFAGARTALGFNVFGSRSSRTSTSEDGAFGLGDGSSTYAGASLGVRRYTRVRSALAGFGTLGVVGSYNRSTYGGSGEVVSRQAAVGGFGELGATYLVARRLGVNLFTRAQLARGFGRYTSPAGGLDPAARVTQRTRGWDAQAGGVGVAATLFF